MLTARVPAHVTVPGSRPNSGNSRRKRHDQVRRKPLREAAQQGRNHTGLTARDLGSKPGFLLSGVMSSDNDSLTQSDNVLTCPGCASARTALVRTAALEGAVPAPGHILPTSPLLGPLQREHPCHRPKPALDRPAQETKKQERLRGAHFPQRQETTPLSLGSERAGLRQVPERGLAHGSQVEPRDGGSSPRLPHRRPPAGVGLLTCGYVQDPAIHVKQNHVPAAGTCGSVTDKSPGPLLLHELLLWGS